MRNRRETRPYWVPQRSSTVPQRSSTGAHPRLALFSPAAASAALGVTQKTLTRWHAAGKIRAELTRGGRRRYFGDDVRALAAVLAAVDETYVASPDAATMTA